MRVSKPPLVQLAGTRCEQVCVCVGGGKRDMPAGNAILSGQRNFETKHQLSEIVTSHDVLNLQQFCKHSLSSCDVSDVDVDHPKFAARSQSGAKGGGQKLILMDGTCAQQFGEGGGGSSRCPP